jgi:hypothetical protein
VNLDSGHLSPAQCGVCAGKTIECVGKAEEFSEKLKEEAKERQREAAMRGNKSRHGAGCGKFSTTGT